MDFNHKPVMLNECITGLDITPNGIYFDGTLGGGGHSLEIVKRLDCGRLICVDKDAEAIMFAAERLKDYKEKISLIHDDFKNAAKILDSLGVDALDGFILDLGVSSYQIDSAERGFSYIHDAPLDMRMNRDQYLTAFNVVNEYSVAKLEKILFEYGEERYGKKIAEKIAKVREKESIRTTGQLAKIVEECYPPSVRWKGGHPAKRTFQAIRIEVNGELDELYDTVGTLCKRLKKGGRAVIITFHSLEDRIVKNCFKELETDCICDKSLPKCVCGKVKEIEILNRKPITASEEELKNNSRAQSAKLRIAKRV